VIFLEPHREWFWALSTWGFTVYQSSSVW
jgi:hypothetical protein